MSPKKNATPDVNLVFTNHVARTLDQAVELMMPSSVHVLVDVNTEAFVLPLLQAESKAVAGATVIRVKAGEMFKNLDSLTSIWKQLGDSEANRNSLLINLGGGVVTDMGSFAAATFKRGISFINVPTTLLCAVDACVGGKTGINFNGLKNEIGMFRDADLAIVSTLYFNTLTSQELLSGYAEMLKHALVCSTELTKKILAYDVTNYNPDTLLKLLEESVGVKQKYVKADHEDRGGATRVEFRPHYRPRHGVAGPRTEVSSPPRICRGVRHGGCLGAVANEIRIPLRHPQFICRVCETLLRCVRDFLRRLQETYRLYAPRQEKRPSRHGELHLAQSAR